MSRDAVDAAFNVDLVFAEMAEGNLSNQELTFPFLKILGQDIASEKKKIGGDWVIAMALPTRQMREIIQSECSATFVIFNMDENTQRKRIGNYGTVFENHQKKVSFNIASEARYVYITLKCCQKVFPDR